MAQFSMRDASDPEFLPEVEVNVSYNDVTEEIELFLDEPIEDPMRNVESPNLRMSLEEAWTVWRALGKALGPDPTPKEES